MFILILCCYPVFSQDSIVLNASISEKKNLQFQEHFFDALTQKAIKNYQKAITSLEECNSIIPNETAVLFELSKNYFTLDKNPEALEYINKAIKLDTENLWLLEHLVTIQKKNKDYEEAIKTQYKIAENYPEKKQEIVYLHLKNKDNNAALTIIEELSAAKLLNARLKRIRANLTKPKKVTSKKTKVTTSNSVKNSLKDNFNNNKSYANLKKLLTQLNTDKNPELLDFSGQGLSLFPAQPFVYLMNAKAYNQKKEPKRALKSLQNGIDFVIDDDKLEKQFYAEMVIAYTAIGDTKNASKYKNKL